jgi:TRAP-type C4-dicarboxylate transport system substrate-binding protein
METMEREPSLKAELEKQKVIMVAPYTSGQTIIGTKTCLTSIADLKGKTVRTAGGIRAQHLKNLGANPVFLPSTDAYEALDRGTVSALGDFPASLMMSYKIYEVSKCFYMSNQGVAVAAGLFMNLDVFSSFPKDIQEMFINLRADYAEMLARDLMKYEDDFIKELQTKHRVKVVYPSPEDQKIIWEAGEKANEDLIKTQEAGGHKTARRVVNYYATALKKYEAERAKKK